MRTVSLSVSGVRRVDAGPGRRPRASRSAFAVALVMGFTSISFMTASTAIVQLRAKASMRGRVLALQAMVFLGSTPIGGPILGWICERLGARWGLATGALATLAAAAYGLLAVRRVDDVHLTNVAAIRGGRRGHRRGRPPDRLTPSLLRREVAPMGAMDEITDALAAQQGELTGLLEGLDDAGWARPSPCEGWDVADVVLHLVQTNLMAEASLGDRLDGFYAEQLEGARPAANVDDGAAAMVDLHRGAPNAGAARAVALRCRPLCPTSSAPGTRAGGSPGWRARCPPRTLATTRLAETWIHTNDVADALGVRWSRPIASSTSPGSPGAPSRTPSSGPGARSAARWRSTSPAPAAGRGPSPPTSPPSPPSPVPASSSAAWPGAGSIRRPPSLVAVGPGRRRRARARAHLRLMPTDAEPTLLEGLATTRAIRRFTDEPIPDADLVLDPLARHPRPLGLQPAAVPLPRAPRRRARPNGPRSLLGRGLSGVVGARSAARTATTPGRAPTADSPKARMAPHDAALRRSVRGHAPVVVLACSERDRAAARRPTGPASTRPARTCCWRPGPSATAGC